MNMLTKKNFPARLSYRVIPSHMHYNRGGRFTGGHNTIQNLLKAYTTPLEKKTKLEHVINRIRNYGDELPARVKASLNKIASPRRR